MASAEMLDHARGEQQIDGGYDGESERGGEDGVGIARVPGEVGQRRHGERKRSDFGFVEGKKLDQAVGDQNADERARAPAW